MSPRLGSSLVRLWAFRLIGMILFGLLGFRLFQLQVLHSAEFREKSDNNRFRVLEIAAPRGVMRDRAGRLLVTNRSAYSCYGVPRELWKDPQSLRLLEQALGYEEGFLAQEVIQPNRRSFVPLRLKRDLSFHELSCFEELRNVIPGAFLEMEQKRAYPDLLAAHAIGYVSEVSKDELANWPGLRMGDLVGKRGLERLYDQDLRGKPGARVTVVNALGQEVAPAEDLGRVEPTAGKELWLTLDRDLQMLAESLLVGAIGAAVAMDVRTGGVLAMASTPTYDPRIFAGRVNTVDWNALLEDPLKPMLNRAVQTTYPPGSTIKMAMLLEGLESGAIPSDWTVSCSGSYTYGDRPFKCWKKGGHGRIVPLTALEQSCDVFFYRLGLQIGADGVHNAMHRLHLGETTGVDQTSEAQGLAPSENYYNRRYGPRGWTKGFVLSLAIGQGEVLVTPVQMCAYAAALANGAIWRQPHLVRAIFDPVTGEVTQRPAPSDTRIEASPENIALVREGMRRVVWGDAGTARAQRDPQVAICGKTGTAQNPHGDDHAWFVGFAPAEDPIIATCVLIEFGEHGSSVAAPISKEIMKRYVLTEQPERAELALQERAR
ncbi:MAG: penicillin-binding protein 2 [bacterium]|nr:penicillin-binding protein 2 [bacterium]